MDLRTCPYTKGQRYGGGIEEIVISLYSRGMNVRDFELQIKDIYDYTICDATISEITAKIHPHIPIYVLTVSKISSSPVLTT